jgi:hypothetical protein
MIEKGDVVTRFWYTLKNLHLVQLHNATNVVAYLKLHVGHQHLAYDGARRGICRCFYEVKIGDVNRVDQFNAWTVEGTQGFH